MGKKIIFAIIGQFCMLLNLSSSRNLMIVRASSTPPKKSKSVIRRDRISTAKRMINRARKSEIAFRMKKALNAVNTLSGDNSLTESDLKSVEILISKLYSEVDKAVSKGVIHSNTGSR